MREWALLGVVLLIGACQSQRVEKQNSEATVAGTSQKIDIQGHRGARGLLPENSIRGFIKAIELGVTTLEMDLCITKDSMVIVSHEPFMSNEICLDKDRNMLSSEAAKALNIYEMNYSEVKQFDCGSLMHLRFPSQGKVKIVKPLLSDVIRRSEDFTASNSLPRLRYNIELKSQPEHDNIYHPEPARFARLVFEEIDGKLDWARVTIQSFDIRILQYFNENYPEIQLSLLIENEKSWNENLTELGFKPAVYSCHYKLLTPQIVDELHDENILVIPWTINDVEEMQELLEWGVDGIITDYPDRAKELTI